MFTQEIKTAVLEVGSPDGVLSVENGFTSLDELVEWYAPEGNYPDADHIVVIEDTPSGLAFTTYNNDEIREMIDEEIPDSVRKERATIARGEDQWAERS